MKKEYMDNLKTALNNSSVKNKEELMNKIERRYDLGLEAGLKEEEIEEMLGDVETIVDQYMDSIVDTDDENQNSEPNKSYKIELSSIGSDITIDLVDTKDIEYELVDCNIDYYDVITNPNEFKIKYKKSKFLGLNRKLSGNIYVKLPKSIVYDSVSIQSTSGDINITELLNANNIKITTVSGDINFDNIKCNSIKFSIVSGDVTGLSIEGKEVIFDTVSGDISCNIINCDNLSLSSVSGDMNITHANANIKASTVSGDILVNNQIVGVNVKKTIKGLFR